MESKKNINALKDQVSKLMAALSDVNFECERLEIINSNLEAQLKEANRELNNNIAKMQELENKIQQLEKDNKELREKLHLSD